MLTYILDSLFLSGTRVRGGLTLREALTLCELINETGKLSTINNYSRSPCSNKDDNIHYLNLNKSNRERWYRFKYYNRVATVFISFSTVKGIIMESFKSIDNSYIHKLVIRSNCYGRTKPICRKALIFLIVSYLIYNMETIFKYGFQTE